MIDVNEIPDQVLTDIAENIGIEDGDCDEKDLIAIGQLSAQEAFDRFLIWNGIQGYTGMILEAVDGLEAAGVIAEIREILSTNAVDSFMQIRALIDEKGHRKNSTLMLVAQALDQGFAALRPVSLLKIKELIG
jgi:hypothetical protein